MLLYLSTYSISAEGGKEQLVSSAFYVILRNRFGGHLDGFHSLEFDGLHDIKKRAFRCKNRGSAESSHHENYETKPKSGTSVPLSKKQKKINGLYGSRL